MLAFSRLKNTLFVLAVLSLFVSQISCLSVEEGLDYTLENVEFGGEGDVWTGVTSPSYYGGDSVKSGICDHDQSSWFSTEITGISHVSFYWKVSSEEDYDYLRFYVDDNLEDQITGEQNWTHTSYYLSPKDTHTLKWTYYKDDIITDNDDCGWVDKLETGSETITLAEALDNEDLEFTTGGDSQWYGQDKDSYSGGSAARSGLLKEEDLESWMKTTVEGPGKIHFVAKLFEGYSTSNEMIFSIDGTIHREFYASDDWQEYDSYINSEGTHELKWTFRLEGVFDDEPRDFGYGLVDQVIFEKGSVGISLNEALDNDDLEFITGGNAAWYGQKEDSYYGKSAAKTDGLEEDQFTVLYFNVTGKGKVSFYWKVETWGDEDYLTFETDFETRFNISGNVDWTKATYKLETDDEHIVAWIFRKQSNADIDQGFGWVDKIVFSKDDDDVVSSANSILPLALAFFSSLFLFFSVLF